MYYGGVIVGWSFLSTNKDDQFELLDQDIV